MRRPTRSELAYGAASAASAIALGSAALAWVQLQDPANASGIFPGPAWEALLGFAVPLVAVAAAVGLSWLARRLGRASRLTHKATEDPDRPEADSTRRAAGRRVSTAEKLARA